MVCASVSTAGARKRHHANQKPQVLARLTKLLSKIDGKRPRPGRNHSRRRQDKQTVLYIARRDARMVARLPGSFIVPFVFRRLRPAWHTSGSEPP